MPCTCTLQSCQMHLWSCNPDLSRSFDQPPWTSLVERTFHAYPSNLWNREYHLRWRPYSQREISAASRLWLSYIAKSIWHTLPVLFARLVLLLLSSAVLHPINVFSSCRIFWTIVTDVWTIDIMRACEVLVVRLQRLTFP